MARGDVVSDVVSIGNGATSDYQPASGVETMLTSVHVEDWIPGTAVNVTFDLLEGSNLTRIWSFNHTLALAPIGLKVFLTNTRYLRITNGSGGTLKCGYTGIQTK